VTSSAAHKLLVSVNAPRFSDRVHARALLSKPFDGTQRAASKDISRKRLMADSNDLLITAKDHFVSADHITGSDSVNGSRGHVFTCHIGD